GGRVERGLPFDFGAMKTIKLSLRSPDFTTAERIETAINKEAGRPIAKMLDATAVELVFDPEFGSPAHMMSAIENIEVEPEQGARVVVDQRSGTIVLGADVRISSVAVAQGNLSIKISETPQALQPNPFSKNGETVVLPRTDISVQDSDNKVAVVNANVTLSDLVAGLNSLGVSPREMIDILKAIKAAGALHADLVVE
ncbi:MAG TPA: flagellar basal body P-ring protein FlgI, partial [Parvularculaceae bacterium]|nr:flagellar basal body P-ring protein FlgI [Parvularculaceae bacterium]